MTCRLFEDEHLLVVNKPAGMNTHSPSPFAGEGIYEWLKHREPRWAKLAIVHRLDKETSGILLFTKTPLANKSVTEQFTNRLAQKKYQLLTDRPVSFQTLAAKSSLVRAGERYVSRPEHRGGNLAETRFTVVRRENGRTWIEAEPVTGRTHQIRVHAAAHGFPILGDALYGGSAFERACLHAGALRLRHPATDKEIEFAADPDFFTDPRLALRRALIQPEETDSFRVVHGAADGWPRWYVDKLGEFLLSQSEESPEAPERGRLEQLAEALGVRGVYHKRLERRVRQIDTAQASPRFLFGERAPAEFLIRENGLQFSLSFEEGYSVGLFLDQRDNRRRLLTNHLAADFSLAPNSLRGRELLNTFAYTCAFSVCAAKAGARVTSLDLSKKYLDWGGRNFELNGMDPAEHDFIFGDAFDWMKRLGKKGRKFDGIILDPPTFSQSKERGRFRAAQDYGELMNVALPLLTSEGVVLASTNAAMLKPEAFLEDLRGAIRESGRQLLQEHYVPQPPDFPIAREEPGYLKTIWLRVGS